MRELEVAGIAFDVCIYESDDTSPASGYGIHVAELLGEDPASAFKTLVASADGGDIVVCCIPVAEELDLKKAARASGHKTLSMLHMADLERVTGYVRGGCSPVGMKKAYPVLIDETAELFDRIGISGGKRGISLSLSPEDLVRHTNAILADITREGQSK